MRHGIAKVELLTRNVLDLFSTVLEKTKCSHASDKKPYLYFENKSHTLKECQRLKLQQFSKQIECLQLYGLCFALGVFTEVIKNQHVVTRLPVLYVNICILFCCTSTITSRTVEKITVMQVLHLMNARLPLFL